MGCHIRGRVSSIRFHLRAHNPYFIHGHTTQNLPYIPIIHNFVCFLSVKPFISSSHAHYPSTFHFLAPPSLFLLLHHSLLYILFISLFFILITCPYYLRTFLLATSSFTSFFTLHKFSILPYLNLSIFFASSIHLFPAFTFRPL